MEPKKRRDSGRLLVCLAITYDTRLMGPFSVTRGRRLHDATRSPLCACFFLDFLVYSWLPLFDLFNLCVTISQGSGYRRNLALNSYNVCTRFSPLLSADAGKEEKLNHKRAELSTKLDIDLWEYRRRRRTSLALDSTPEKKENRPPAQSLWGVTISWIPIDIDRRWSSSFSCQLEVTGIVVRCCQ